VALGNNNTPREIREIRDLQGNRRIGAVKNATIQNAWVALSPDGQYFAAWSAGQNQIGVWTVKPEKPRGSIRVAGVAVPRLLMFAGNNRLVAIGGGDDLFTWSMPVGTYERSHVIPKINGGIVAGLSPGGRYLAIAVPDSKKPFLRVIDLAGGIVAGELTLAGFAGTAPTCHAVAFSPDGTELAALYETPRESNVLVFGVSQGRLVLHVRIEGSLRTRLRAADWQGGHGLEWFPGKDAWLVYGQGVIDRESGELTWTLPGDASGGIRVGHVIDDGRVLLLGGDSKDAALEVLEISTQ
jgi:WD40 repeat protein